MTALLFDAWTIGAALMVGAWIVQWRTGNAGWVDAIWPLCMASIAGFYALQGDAQRWVSLSIALMAGAWAIRLSIHVSKRVAGTPEDSRYKDLRQWLGRAQQYGLFAFFQLQALAALPLSMSWLLAVVNPNQLHAGWVLVAWAIWLTAMAGEWISDHQLTRHRANPDNRGKTCRNGLWRYSRHPNYFFEWLHWTSYLPLCVGAPLAGLSLLSPTVMILFLVLVTGIPHAERRALRNRGDDYRRYQQSTSAFFPWFPKETHDERRH